MNVSFDPCVSLQNFLSSGYDHIEIIIINNIKMLKLLLIVMVAVSIAIDPQLGKHLIPIYGNESLGYYYVDLYIGSPPQKQSVILTTASSILALPCSLCTSCGNKHLEPFFDLTKSSTSRIISCNATSNMCKDACKSNQCVFSIFYSEGSSLSGILIEDQIQLEPDSKGEAISTSFGCTTKETNLFYTQVANGVFGLSPKRNSLLLEQLYEKHSQYTGQQFLFQICLSDNGGQMGFGKINQKIMKSKTSVKTTFNSSKNVYSLNNVSKIQISNNTILQGLDLQDYGIFIEVGSTLSYFKRKSYDVILKQVQESCSQFSSKCKKAQNRGIGCYEIIPDVNSTYSQALLSIFPSIDIYINGEIIKWLPNKYFTNREGNNKEFCLGILSYGQFLLGSNWMVDKNIVFNLKQETVQVFSQVQCKQTAIWPIISQDAFPSQTTLTIQNSSQITQTNQTSLTAQDSQIVQIPLQYAGSVRYISTVQNNDESWLQKIIYVIIIVIIFFAVGIAIYVLKRLRKQIYPTSESLKPQQIANTELSENKIQINNEENTEKKIQSE